MALSILNPAAFLTWLCPHFVRRTQMDFHTLLPLGYYLIASLLNINGLKRRRHIRLMLVGPVLFFSFLSLLSCHRLAWITGADSSLASLLVFYLLYSTKTLAFDQHTVNPEMGAHDWTFIDCYRTWNNPRKLPLRLSLLEKKVPCATSSRGLFAFNQALKAGALWSFEHFAFQRIFIYALGKVSVTDFSPSMEFSLHLSYHQISVRAIMSVQWIWRACFFLEFYHCLLAIAFVTVLRFDDPGDWPPLFGSPMNASSVRGFWGRFWHNLTIPTYVYYSQLASRRLFGIRQGSTLEKSVTALLIFTLSGLSHSLVGWSLGDAALSRDIFFFELCFLAAAAETAVTKTSLFASLRRCSPPSLRQAAGMGWVSCFFFFASPMWIYPKVYQALLSPKI